MLGLLAFLLFLLASFPALAADDYVVLLHGIARTSSTMDKLQERLKKEGYSVLNIDYESREYTIEVLAEKMHEAVTSFVTDKDKKVHFVGYSMGGLVTRAYLGKHRPENLGRVLFLGTPNQGSEVADFLKDVSLYQAFYGPAGQQLTTGQNFERLFGEADYETGVIAGTQSIDPISALLILPPGNDGKVSVASTHIKGEKDHIEVETTHTFMPVNDTVIRQAVYFLEHGKFSREAQAGPASNFHNYNN